MPTLTGLASAVTFGENSVNAAPQIIDSDVTFTDVEGNFDGGVLKVTGLLPEDAVSVRDQGTGTGQIGSSGGVITYQGVAIGTAVKAASAGAASGGGDAGARRLVGARRDFLAVLRRRVGRLGCAMSVEPSTTLRRSARRKCRSAGRDARPESGYPPRIYASARARTTPSTAPISSPTVAATVGATSRLRIVRT